MQKQKKIMKIGVFLAIVLMFFSKESFASELSDLANKTEYTEQFKRYIEFSDEEKENALLPRIFNTNKTKKRVTNPFYLMSLVGSTSDSNYSLIEDIPQNVVVKDQKSTNSCWTFASLSSLETNLALNSSDKTKVYDFSERHMEYATSRLFANNQINKNGFNRKVGDGGTWDITQSYLTNGTGAIDENQMVFEDNENTIDIGQIQNKTVTSQVYDTVVFPSYDENDDKTQIKNQMKAHIKKYGSISAYIHGAQLFSDYYNNETGALYCDNSEECLPDHGVSIVGWNDDYSIDNFNTGHVPKSKGAWIIKNSWGTKLEEDVTKLKQDLYNSDKAYFNSINITSASAISDSILTNLGYTIENGKASLKVGDNGFMYVSYEDVNIYLNLFGIIKAADTLDYENIYQYDNFGNLYAIDIQSENSSVYVANVFDKKTTGKEYITQVAIDAPETYSCTVYVNPNGTSKEKNSLQKVKLKAGGYSESFDAGYHTLEFEKPIEIKANNFVVAIEIQPTNQDGVYISAEANITPLNANIGKIYNVVELESEKCFYTTSDFIDKNEWQDLSKMATVTNGEVLNCDSSIKAFTTSKVDESLLEPDSESETPSKEENAKNTDFTNAKVTIPTAKMYFFTDSTKESYATLNVEINGVERVLDNDSYEYYYYLSNSDSENDISNWIKITEVQNDKNKIKFTINEKDVPNSEELNNSDSDNMYIYIKEVVKKGTKESTLISNAMLMDLDENTEFEIYSDNEKVALDDTYEEAIESFTQDTNTYDNSSNGKKSTTSTGTKSSLITSKDATTATKVLPKAGIKTVVICIAVISLIGIFGYIRYSNLKKYIK